MSVALTSDRLTVQLLMMPMMTMMMMDTFVPIFLHSEQRRNVFCFMHFWDAAVPPGGLSGMMV